MIDELKGELKKQSFIKMLLEKELELIDSFLKENGEKPLTKHFLDKQFEKIIIENQIGVCQILCRVLEKEINIEESI